jgi:hypothetical protein
MQVLLYLVFAYLVSALAVFYAAPNEWKAGNLYAAAFYGTGGTYSLIALSFDIVPFLFSLGA